MTQANHEQDASTTGVVLRRPQLADGAAITELIRRCPPLDLNSSYCYFLLCAHHADTCVVAQQGGQTVGFLSAYRPPNSPHTLFVWQVAVDEAVRGQGLAGRMLNSLLARPACIGVRFIETTVAPSNHASRRVFSRFATRHHVAVAEYPFLLGDHFGAEAHEEERLFRIGPLTSSGTLQRD